MTDRPSTVIKTNEELRMEAKKKAPRKAPPTEEERRAAEAERILKEPLLIEALAGIEAEAADRLLANSATASDPDRSRREHIDTINTIKAFRAKMKAYIEAGKLAAKRREDAAAAAQKKHDDKVEAEEKQREDARAKAQAAYNKTLGASKQR